MRVHSCTYSSRTLSFFGSQPCTLSFFFCTQKITFPPTSMPNPGAPACTHQNCLNTLITSGDRRSLTSPCNSWFECLPFTTNYDWGMPRRWPVVVSGWHPAAAIVFVPQPAIVSGAAWTRGLRSHADTRPGPSHGVWMWASNANWTVIFCQRYRYTSLGLVWRVNRGRPPAPQCHRC